ncbi:MAG: DUF3021 domain-containing protein [Clostridia bacterium]|nr:DUF3021 domain-containing protein [Clostridia bacterium]
MKSFARDFVRRGFIACGLGPVVLAVFYLLLQYKGAVEVLSVNQVCIGIFSLSALAFIAGGMNAVYKIEKLPLMAAILIHGSVLYVCYLVTYLLNDWLESGILPILVFSAIFISGFLVIWLIIYSVVKRKTEKLNKILEQKQHIADER